VILVGNDIVALDGQAGRSREPVFYSKIITPAEKELYSTERLPDLPFEHFVWLCWAVKEAAFKCIQKAEPGALFWGPRIKITELAPLTTPPGDSWLDIGDPMAPYHGFSALARFGSHRLQAWAIVTNNYILAVSTAGETFCSARFGEISWGIRKIGSIDRARQSADVRTFVLEKLQRLLPGQPLTIQKAPDGYPFVMNGSKQAEVGLSFSHHADLVSYAFLLE
jgi:hypothetical protein